jgi:hypothetical protein
MIFKFFNSPKSVEKRFKRYVGKPVTLGDGRVIGTVDGIKLSKNDLKPISIIVRMGDGSTKEFNVNEVGAVFMADKVVFQRFNDEYASIVSTLRNEVASIRERLRDIVDKLIDSATCFSRVVLRRTCIGTLGRGSRGRGLSG